MYIVVRTPRENFDDHGKGSLLKAPPSVDGICYGGVFRMPWFDVEEDYYRHCLPQGISDDYQRLRTINRDFTGIKAADNLPLAERLLLYANTLAVRNEIILIDSPLVRRIKKFPEVVIPSDAMVLGYDVIDLGHWSLLLHGFFYHSEVFSSWKNALNKHGLFDTKDSALRIVDAYDAAAKAGVVEDRPPKVYGVDAIMVLRVPLNALARCSHIG